MDRWLRSHKTTRAAKFFDDTGHHTPIKLTTSIRQVVMTDKIKSMKLYNSVERVYNELRAIGKLDSRDIQAEELYHFDQLHYHGTRSIERAIKKLKINEKSKILEIGSGLGGPARCIAQQTGASVTALEIQADHHRVAEDLTKRCNLDHLIHHVNEDFLQFTSECKFDALVSWLAIYHIPNRTKLLEISSKILKPKGYFFTEDFALHKPLSDSETEDLRKNFYANHLVSYHDFEKEFTNSDFELLELQDTTQSWATFTEDRYNKFLEQKEEKIKIHGEETVSDILFFYSFAKDYLQSGKLGGVRLVATKKEEL